MKYEELTKRQNDVLLYIKKYTATHGYPPAVREICKGLELSSPATVQAHLNELVKKGYIQKTESKFRTIELLVDNEFTEKEEKEDVVSVPLLGKVSCGNPIEAIENPDEFFTLPASLIPARESIFTLKCQGDSMINVGIYDKDIVIVQKQNVARNGDMVVAMTDEGEVTLKTFYKEADHIRLQPENDTMAPIIVQNCTILGKAIGLYRKL